MGSDIALTETDLSGMLQTNHPSQGHISLTNMLSSNSVDPNSTGRDLFSGPLPYSPIQRQQSIGGQGQLTPSMNMNMNMQSGSLERPSMSSLGSGGSQSSMSQSTQWPFASDEKWEMDCKNEVLDSSIRLNAGGFGARMDAPLQPLNSSLARTSNLQRYHSAPSSILQSLAEFNEESFPHISSPLGNSADSNRDDHPMFFNENLVPIMESAPSRWTQQSEPEKVALRSNAMSSAEQYFAIQADKARLNALQDSAMAKENMENSLSRMQNIARGAAELRGGGPVDVSLFRNRSLNNNLLRQSSSPADLLAAINEREDEMNPKMQPLRSQDDSLSVGSFGEDRSNKKSIDNMYSNPMYVFNDAMMGGGGVWGMPTNLKANLGGKRVRFPEEMMDDSDLLRDNSQNPTGGRINSLTRHQSLPTNINPGDPAAAMGMGYDDLLDLYSPCKTRARRGYATHPRSIAERNRRSRISERMKKLQDLVPNMDKQTNTADMLDEAVEYVKHLQTQVKDLSETIVRLKNSIRAQTAS
ncbi:uncharacterized protein [Physcomitrium patens]|uniref:BHLH domain-containing protein n=1 Tax=Physcomitrium patens TaxID=3218 RepID=A0A2K1JIK7_PHYPA|nr:transcription factor bHLH122-like isoform X1 [Physcomitrium patens]PNR41387.1 hypothetical protein PHYPA_018790 [Physcomitrium patens]|eukprot:XP_024395286.1 transcription factor bHLH122-like isoform X1 [Physcomitrella patens]